MLDVIKKLFGTDDLYKLLKISQKDAQDPKKLRSAYLKAALQCHPDKATDDQKELYTQKFQTLSKIIEVLQDNDLRKSYDETGEWPETETFNLSDTDFRMSKSEFITKFHEFKTYFQGSDEERAEIEKLYKEGSGNLVYIIDRLYCAELLTDEGRIQAIIDDLIKRKVLKRIAPTPATERELKRRKLQAKKEEKEAEELCAQLGLGDISTPGSLEQQILARREAAGHSFLDDLEKKYCQPQAKKKTSSKSKSSKRK